MQVAKYRRRQPCYLRLEGCRCDDCGHLSLPCMPRCPSCRSDRGRPFFFSGRGHLVTHTVVYEAPSAFVPQTPYVAGLVTLEEGVTIPAMLTDVDPDSIEPGMPLVMVTRKLNAQGESGPILYGYKFAPA